MRFRGTITSGRRMTKMKTKAVEDIYDDIIAGNVDLQGFKVWLAGWSVSVVNMMKEHYGDNDDHPVPGHRD
jgi:hypothetical protein